jgi:gluconolactonase
MNRRECLSAAAALPLASSFWRVSWAAEEAAVRWPAEKLDLSTLRTLTEIAGPEGPSMLPDGSIATVEHVLGQVIRVGNDGVKQVLATTGRAPVGTAVGHDGMVYVAKLNRAAVAKKMTAGRASQPAAPAAPPAEDSAAALIRIDPKTLQSHTVYDSYQGQPLVGPNDLVVDRWGDLWLTDFADNCVYCCRTDGSSIQRVISDAPGVNGITLSPDGRMLYIMNNGQIVGYTVEARGRLQQRAGQPVTKILAPWPEGVETPDGMRMEASGNLLLGCARGGLLVMSPKGRIVSQTLLPGLQPINMVFGGPGRTTLYVAAGAASRSQGKLVALTWPRAGAKPL